MSIADRKHHMPFGACVDVARELGVSKAYVSAVMNDAARARKAVTQKKVRRVQIALARKLGRPVDDVFPAEQRVA